MALTPFVRATQAISRIAANAVSPSVKAAFAGVRSVINFPAENIQATQARARVLAQADDMEIQVTQAVVRSVIVKRTSDPHIRAWTFTLDGHDYYVLRLGEIETLVYDTHSEQWYVWGSNDGNVWRAYTGINWQGGNFFSGGYGSNVLVGDDGNGALYFLNPTRYIDDDALVGEENQRQFLREVIGQVSARTIDAVPCFGVQLGGAIGEISTAGLTAVTLYTSDDQGHNYSDHGTVTLTAGAYDTRAEWWSLGSFASPGRLFKVQDYGALQRIDWLEMLEPPKQEG